MSDVKLLMPADDVRHEVYGIGKVCPTGTSVDLDAGTALIDFEDGGLRFIALNMLTKFEPESGLGLHGKLYQAFNGVSDPALIAGDVFREHFKSKRKDIIDAHLQWNNVGNDDLFITEVKRILFGDEV